MDCNTIIEGCVKFRDGKKWKSRWCVMRKLSPVADCLHLQLYRDSKDRYKQGHTKASLSLQQFLGYETGFTLDKESNTIAIICQDVIVVLAFDTRERLIQWQVKISNNLGEDQQFLIQISSRPPKAKLSSGPARLHIQEGKFCITIGVPPKLTGLWEIQHLRRFGVLDGKFCFEGGSRCGKGEGLYVLLTDQGNDITKCLQLASEGKLESKGRLQSRNISSYYENHYGDDVDVHRSASRMANSSTGCRIGSRISQPANDLWSSMESQCNIYGHGDTTSLGDLSFDLSNSQGCSLWSGESSLGRCISCIEKLGSTPKISTAANTPGSMTTYNPLTMLMNSLECNTLKDNDSKTYHRCPCSDDLLPDTFSTNKRIHVDAQRPPSRPPKPAKYRNMESRKTMILASPMRKMKQPLPLPLAFSDECCSSDGMKKVTICSDKRCNNDNDNYDIPKTMAINKVGNTIIPIMPYDEREYYDTPRNILAGQAQTAYGNYDVPPAAIPVNNKHLNYSGSQSKNDDDDGGALFSDHQTSPSSSYMLLRGNNLNTEVELNNTYERKCSDLYAVVDVSKKTKNRRKEESHSHGNYMNIELQKSPEYKNAINSLNYINLEFSNSLKNYENVEINRKEKMTFDSLNIDVPPCNNNNNYVKNDDKIMPCTCLNGNNTSGDYMFMSPGNLNKSASNPSLSENKSPERRFRKISVNDCTGYDTLVKRRKELQVGASNVDDDESTDVKKDRKKIIRPKETILLDGFRKFSNVSNRDSSSSNDSGFSTSSLKQNHFRDFEMPLTTVKSTKPRHYSFNQHYFSKNYNNKEPQSTSQRSKSTDPFGDFTFQFHKTQYPSCKSSSVEAELLICLNKPRYYKDSCASPIQGVIDCTSTSSGTSDMSDYIETLSISSHGSSEKQTVTDGSRSLHGLTTGTTWMKPRSGNEYQKVDRLSLFNVESKSDTKE